MENELIIDYKMFDWTLLNASINLKCLCVNFDMLGNILGNIRGTMLSSILAG